MKLSIPILTMLLVIPLMMTSCDRDEFCVSDELKRQHADRACPEIYDPVCGCDGQTYSNSCYAQRAGVVLYREGACEKDEQNKDCYDKELQRKYRDVACPRIYDPVCGCDGNTYSNDCEAKRAGVTRFKSGECDDRNPKNCLSRELRERYKDVACPRIYDPVCGCDGNTYSNDCEAKRAGVTRFKSGECDDRDGRIREHFRDGAGQEREHVRDIRPERKHKSSRE